MQYVAMITNEGKRRLITFPDCPGCQTVAEPGEDLERVAKEALEGWLEAHLVAGQHPPSPKRVRGDLHVVVPSGLAIKIALRRRRNEMGLTQAQLAKRAGISQPAVSQIEDPDSNLTLETLEKIASALEAEIDIDLRHLVRGGSR